jgi:hypothetical protein
MSEYTFDLPTNEKQQARAFLLAHREFLRSISAVDSRRQIIPILAGASDSDLDSLAYVIYLISQKQIPLLKSDRDKIVFMKRYTRFRHFMRRKSDYDHFKSLDRSAKVRELLELGFALKLALNPLFYRTTRPATKEDQGAAEVNRLYTQQTDTAPQVKGHIK